MDYNLTFETRAADYAYATRVYPNVLKNELAAAAKMVDARAGDVVVNIPGACVDISPYLCEGVIYKSYETNGVFAELTNTQKSTFYNIPEADGSVDIVVSLVSLHHSTDDERQRFYNEAHRILKPGGKLVIGDVEAGSRMDDWLNVFVNKYNGHAGQFWSVEDGGLMTGFDVETMVETYTWDSTNAVELIDFTKHLFGLKRATDEEIYAGLQQYLGATESGFVWSLLYFVATKPTVVPV